LQNSECSSQLQGNQARATRGHWSFRYVTDASRSEFGLLIHENYETERCIYGGASIDLVEFGSVHCQSDPKVPQRLKSLIQR
jgi:hypothetical protein